MAKVLIADKLSPAAQAVFEERGIESEARVGLNEDELIEAIGRRARFGLIKETGA